MSRAFFALGCATLIVVGASAAGPVPAARSIAASGSLLAAGPVPAVAPAQSVTAQGVTAVLAYRAPVVGPVTVLRAFQAPAGPYAAGHRGVDLATAAGSAVLAAGSGRVRFAGPVAGRGVVVIEHADGVLTEYEPLAVTVTAGEPVSRGQPLGRLAGTHGDCRPSGCLHWGARRGRVYFDPMTLLVGLGPVRLLPWPP